MAKKCDICSADGTKYEFTKGEKTLHLCFSCYVTVKHESLKGNLK